ncbi:putative uncharacterized protein [Desulfovibrio ferrophilus]|uniref:DUF5675 domain-containing protein n=2 Tax=Desulfovibrio ferrophilus TaxID=241368 RepID=A0A2Z6AZT4_9BACT|nr:putative uncharacterized protein [Desulfovibrio ferrophilus]
MRNMPIVELIRLEEAPLGSFGVLRMNKEVVCVTLEPPDKLNAQDVSSIPAQQYLCARVDSPRFGNTFQVQDVPGRTRVLFHSGNTVEDTRGCVLLGTSYGMLGQERGVLGSRNAFNLFMENLSGVDGFHLTILERY